MYGGFVALGLLIPFAVILLLAERGRRGHGPRPVDYERNPIWRAHRNDTGPVALALLAWHWGLTLDLDEARKRCGTTASGTTLFHLVGAVEGLGFLVKAAKADAARGGRYDVLRRCPLPFVAHVEVPDDGAPTVPGLEPAPIGQFVVVLEVGARVITFVETAVGVRSLARTDFERIWTGAILLVEPTPRLARRSFT